jgi:hypothetical protein
MMIPAWILLAIVAAVVPSAAAQAQSRSATPPVQADAAGFAARRLPTLPAVDGVEWVEVKPFLGGPNGTADVAVSARAIGPYVWRIEPAASACTGDVERYRHLFVPLGGSPVLMDEMRSWAYVTPDGRYVFREVLTVLDVSAWRQYDLATALDIANYTFVLAISRDQRRLLIESRSCPYDCGPEIDYYELSLPR